MKKKLAEQLPVQSYTLDRDEKKLVKKYIRGNHHTDRAFMNIYAVTLDSIPHVIADIYIISCEEILQEERMPAFRWVFDGENAGTVKLNRRRVWTDAYLQKLIRNDNSSWYGELEGYVLFHHHTEEAKRHLDEWTEKWKAERYFYNPKGNVIRSIEELIEAVKTKKSDRKNELERLRRQKQWEQLEDLNAISRWVNLRLPQYLIYRQKRNHGHAFCTSCGRNWNYQKEAEYPQGAEWYRMNETFRCPRCGVAVTAKPAGRYQQIKDVVNIIYIQHTETGIAVRFEEAVRTTDWDSIMDIGNVRFRYFTVKVYYLHEREKLKNKRRKLMQKIRNDQIRINKNGIWLYTANLKQATEGTVWGYMDLQLLQKKRDWGETIAYVLNLLRYPGYEALYKCGFWHLLHSAAWTGNDGPLHPQCRKLHEVLGIPRQRLHWLRGVVKTENVSMTMLRFMQHEEEYGQLTAEQLQWINSRREPGVLMQILRYTGRYTRTFNYLQKGNSDVTWRDYLQMAERAGRDMSDDIVLYPKKLKEMHDRLTGEINRERLRTEREALDKEYAHIEEMEERVNRIFGYESEDLIIRAPHTAHEIMEEGQALHHCVYANGYHKRMNQEKTFILFLRKKQCPEIPFYTLEVYPNGNLSQCYGEYDRKPEWNTVEPFIKRYKKTLSKKEWKRG